MLKMENDFVVSTVQRYLYLCGSDIWLDSNGLLIGSAGSRWHKELISLGSVAELRGGVLLAEGGMGKTTFMAQLKDSIQGRSVRLFELGEYAGDLGGFSADYDFKLSLSEEDRAQTVIFDGLDEAPELAGCILRKLRLLSDSTCVWISSRDVAAVRAIQSEWPDLRSYSLAPLGEKDLRALANQAGVDDGAFLEAATLQGVLPICAKPLGCELALSVFRENGLMGVTQRDLWQSGIRRLCDETPSATRQLKRTPEFTLDEIVLCSAWVALCLMLTDKHSVWSREQSHCPPQSLGISDLASTRFSTALIRATLERGVFVPMGDGRIALSHAIYRDYLAALGFDTFIPAKHWISLLLNNQRSAVFPQREGAATWLANYNTELLAELSAIQPELLLSSVDSVQALGPNILCAALLERVDSLSVHQRRSGPILSNLHRLQDSKTPDLLRHYLQDPEASTSVIELATTIAEACKYTELSGVLADRVLDRGLTLRERVDAAYAICRLEDDESKRRLVSLLPIDPSTDPADDLRGLVLRACWPKFLSPDELVLHLIEPQKSNYFGAYRGFLNDDLPASFDCVLDENNAQVFLSWALPHINEDDPFDSLGRLARDIYTACWKWVEVPVVAMLLAEGYAKAIYENRSPFCENQYEDEHATSLVLTREGVFKDADGRMTVLKMLLKCCKVAERDLANIPFNDVPLYTQDDLPLLFDRALADPSDAMTERWAVCIKAVLTRPNFDTYADRVDQLHAHRPELILDSKKLRADWEQAAESSEQMNKKWKAEEAHRKQKHSDEQHRIDTEIRKALNTPDLNPESFEGLASWLFSENGTRSIGSIDIRLSPGWDKLTEDEQTRMLDLAQRYLSEGKIQPTEPNQHQYSVARALTALRLMRPDVYACLSRDIWQKCAVELLKAAMSDNTELLAPLFDTLSEIFPDDATDAVLKIMSQELQRDFISIIHNWGKRLSDSQAHAILVIADHPATDYGQRFRLLDDLARYGKEHLVCRYLDSLFCGGWAVPAEREFHKLRRLAFCLSQESYIRQILDALVTDPSWGKSWVESSIVTHGDAFLSALLSCGVGDVAEMYIWLHDHYPSETCPEHETVYTPSSLDEVHMLKNSIIKHLSQSGRDGSTAALDRVFSRFPNDGWLSDCILDARSAEQTHSFPVLSVVKIKDLYEKNSVACCLINSIQDLMDLTMASIEEYRAHLQDDTPAIRDLWNTLDPIRPCNEEDMSDHLKRYLDLRLTAGVVINREVQIRRKMFAEGVPGSRTDIWIQAFDENGSVLTVCIEVKCNWNKSTKTALSDQLIGKYMSGGTANAGILLLGWFQCSSWDQSDTRLAASKATWPNPDAALADLQQQADQERKSGNDVRAVVLDCTLR